MWKQLQSRPRFRVLHEPESNILCFRWVGDGSLDHLVEELSARLSLLKAECAYRR